MTSNGARQPHHLGSHEKLLVPPSDPLPTGRAIDAVVVPTTRPLHHLDHAASVAQTLKCPLVTLHSPGRTTATGAARHFPDLELIAIDVPANSDLAHPRLLTAELLAGTPFVRESDLSRKRNLALTLGKMLSWSRLVFLDDDMTGVSADDVRTASGLLDAYHAVGFRNTGYPDNSVVCHAYRDAGGEQDSFVGAGALAVDVSRFSSFFPDVYNDDWFFLIDGDKIRPTTVAGEVVQQKYDPFRDPARARSEELGEVLAEGLFWLLDQHRPMTEADHGHWRKYLAARKDFIEGVIGMVKITDLADDDKARRLSCLEVALEQLALISPSFCESYVAAWLQDRLIWDRHIDSLPSGMTVDGALAELARDGTRPPTYIVHED